jgi:hypothetical protein
VTGKTDGQVEKIFGDHRVWAMFFRRTVSRATPAGFEYPLHVHQTLHLHVTDVMMPLHLYRSRPRSVGDHGRLLWHWAAQVGQVVTASGRSTRAISGSVGPSSID